MTPSSQAKIFLSDQRGSTELNGFRSYHTFNFGQFFSEHRFPFENLYVVNDDTLAAGEAVKIKVEQDSCILILPVVGDIEYKDSAGNNCIITTGQLQVIDVAAGAVIELINPYGEELVNFIQLWVRKEAVDAKISFQVIDFDLPANPGQLLAMPIHSNYSAGIGKFAGRQEAIHKLRESNNSLFVLVIEGVFEVQGRLLHARDSLAFLYEEEIELEALSNGAIIFLLELPGISTATTTHPSVLPVTGHR